MSQKRSENNSQKIKKEESNGSSLSIEDEKFLREWVGNNLPSDGENCDDYYDRATDALSYHTLTQALIEFGYNIEKIDGVDYIRDKRYKR